MKISGRKISKKSAEAILQWFRANMSGAKSELDYNSPFQLLCAVLLSLVRSFDMNIIKTNKDSK